MDSGHHASAQRLRVGACLSLSGKFSRFGLQAARGLEAWKSLDDAADLLIEDDRSDVRTLQAALPGVAARSDLLLGPYSTLLMRTAARMAADAGWLLWNHGGSGDDVETACPGHVISLLTPTSRYAESFLRHLAKESQAPSELRIAHGKGRFGRQVANGAEAYAGGLGINSVRTGLADSIIADEPSEDWVLITAGTFEEDIQTVARARALSRPPRLICAVAAGVREFGLAVDDATGTFGIAQWFPGSGQPSLLGPGEGDFLEAYAGPDGQSPDYPAVQAAAGAVLATHCARLTNGTDCGLLWSAAATLDTRTLFGAFTIDPVSGAQISHQIVLVRWSDEGLQAIRASPL
jgi:hypothetical protein